MATPRFISELRSRVGHDLLFLSAVESVVIDDAKVLLVRRTDTGRWTVPGGILEPGEFAPEVAERELWEESGVRGETERLLLLTTGEPMTYPNGDNCQFLLLIFQCRMIGGAPQPDGEETTAVGWFGLDELPVDLSDAQRRAIRAALTGSDPVLDRRTVTTGQADAADRSGVHPSPAPDRNHERAATRARVQPEG